MSSEQQEAVRALKKAVIHHYTTNRSGVTLNDCPKVAAAKSRAVEAGVGETAVAAAVATALSDCFC